MTIWFARRGAVFNEFRGHSTLQHAATPTSNTVETAQRAQNPRPYIVFFSLARCALMGSRPYVARMYRLCVCRMVAFVICVRSGNILLKKSHESWLRAFSQAYKHSTCFCFCRKHLSPQKPQKVKSATPQNHFRCTEKGQNEILFIYAKNISAEIDFL